MNITVSFLVTLVIQIIKVANSNVAFIKKMYAKTMAALPELRSGTMATITI